MGLRAEVPVGERLSLDASYTYSWIDYQANLHWNLRNLRFQNEADGEGHSVSAGVSYGITDRWSARAGVDYHNFETDEGVQTDPDGAIQLNEASWESLGFSLGFRYRFY